MVKVDFLTVFPDAVLAAIRHGVLAKAEQSGLVQFHAVDIRDFARDAHRTVDDKPFGGGPGMILMAPVVEAALESVSPSGSVILVDAAAPRFKQSDASTLSQEKHLTFICGHYGGVDERIRTELCTHAFSIGDFVVTGGELPAALLAQSILRLVPEVLGDPESADRDSFANGLLGFPQYTQPREFRGVDVPDVLLSGHHKAIEDWRRKQSVKRTREWRPDLLPYADLGKNDLDES